MRHGHVDGNAAEFIYQPIDMAFEWREAYEWVAR